jgi:hypothetical protein
LRCSIGLPGGSAGERRPQEGARCSGQWEEPRRGTKPREDRASSHRQRCGEVADPTTEQRLEAEGARVIRHARRANGKGATAAVTRCGCRRGANLRRVIAARIRSGSPLRGGARPDARRGCLVHPSSGARETQRTPCPVPGCNKPGPCGAEKPAEVVRNHEGGTRCCGVAATARWSAFGRSWSGPLQVPEKGTREGSSPRKEGPCGARRSLAGDERQVVPFQSGALNAT